MKRQHLPSLAVTFVLNAKDLDSISTPEELRRDMLDQLLGLDRLPFERLMLTVLQGCGFSDVHLADRMDKWGKTLQGGLDLKAYTETDISQSLTIVQVKQYTYPVPRRFVSEALSTAIRVGADQVILITTSTFGKAARREAISNPLVRVTLIDNAELLDLLIGLHLGVREETVQRVVLDTEFFADLK